MPSSSITPPATAGPTIRPVFSTAEFSTTAFIISSLPTRLTTIARRVGILTAWQVPNRKAAAYTCQTATRFRMVKVATPRRMTVTPPWVHSSRARRSMRSAMMPPSSTRVRLGMP